MAVGLAAPGVLAPVTGARWATMAASIKATDRDDMALLTLPETATVAGVFTQNAFAAAPVQLARQYMRQAAPRALLVNSGNANAGTGDAGLEDARACCEAAAYAVGLNAVQVLPFSTGVIGERLPLSAMLKALDGVAKGLSEDNWLAAAQAIMTTDTVPKATSRTIEVTGADGETEQVTLTGIAKGSGMIRPDMATMLSFVATDARIQQTDSDVALHHAVDRTFNCISVDGDTSTNDSCMLCATGQGVEVTPDDKGWSTFEDALTDLMQELAQAIVRDGEGATRFITLDVRGATTVAEARDAAFTVAHSPLVKTACFAGDPNWGRILAALGRAPIQALDVSRVAIALDDVALIYNGQPSPDYREADGACVMRQSEYTITINLGRGDATARIWTSDLSYEYVRINAEYRS